MIPILLFEKLNSLQKVNILDRMPDMIFKWQQKKHNN